MAFLAYPLLVSGFREEPTPSTDPLTWHMRVLYGAVPVAFTSFAAAPPPQEQERKFHPWESWARTGEWLEEISRPVLHPSVLVVTVHHRWSGFQTLTTGSWSPRGVG
jgi:hypothetical protein